MDFRLRDTNIIKPYEFNYNNQTNNFYIPPDAALYSEFINFTVGIKPIEILELLENLKEEIKELDSVDIKFPVELRKLALIHKINAFTSQILNYDFQEAINKFTNDIYPKLTEKWVKNPDLQSKFTQDCDKILKALEQLEIPDIIQKSEIEDLMTEVTFELNEMKSEISQIENSFVKYILTKMVDKAIKAHLEAVDYFDQGNIDKTEAKEKFTKVKIKISECILEVANCFNIIEQQLHEILITRMNRVEISLNLILFYLPFA
ncbi:MAG: hypothetical protein ACTSRG_24520 [Candidatus Helarchaeota archaeon]